MINGGGVSFYPLEEANLNYVRMFLPNRGSALFQPTALPEIGRASLVGDSSASFYFTEGDVLKELSLQPGIAIGTIATERGLTTFGQGHLTSCLGGAAGVRCGTMLTNLAPSPLSGMAGVSSLEAGHYHVVVQHQKGLELLRSIGGSSWEGPERTLLPGTQKVFAFGYNRALEPVVCASDSKEVRCGDPRSWASAQVVRGLSDVFSVSMRDNVYCGLSETGPTCLRFATVYGGLTPYAAIQGQSFRTPSYSETDTNGGGFALAYNSRTATDTRSELGARFDRAMVINPNAVLALRARLAWAHDCMSDPTLAPVFQALPGASFSVNGAKPARNSALASAGTEVPSPTV